MAKCSLKRSPLGSFFISFTERAVDTFISHSLPLPEKSPPGDGWWGSDSEGHTLVTFLCCRWGRPQPTSYTRPWSPTTNWSPRKAWTRSPPSSASSPGKGPYPLCPNPPSSDNEQLTTFDNTDGSINCFRAWSWFYYTELQLIILFCRNIK